MKNKFEDIEVVCLEVSRNECYSISSCGSDTIHIDESRFFEALHDADRPDRRACIARFLADVLSDDCCLRTFWKAEKDGEAFFDWWKERFPVSSGWTLYSWPCVWAR